MEFNTAREQDPDLTKRTRSNQSWAESFLCIRFLSHNFYFVDFYRLLESYQCTQADYLKNMLLVAQLARTVAEIVLFLKPCLVTSK